MDRGFFSKQSTGMDPGSRRMGAWGFFNLPSQQFYIARLSTIELSNVIL